MHSSKSKGRTNGKFLVPRKSQYGPQYGRAKEDSMVAEPANNKRGRAERH